MSLGSALPASLKSMISQCVSPDTYKGLRGPITVGSFFVEELSRIDKRLVLRWHPYCQVYMVYIKMPYSNLLYSQPVHVIENSFNDFRPPNRTDLEKIRKASWLFSHDGTEGAIDRLDKLMKAQSKATEDARWKALQEWSTATCRAYDLSLKDFQDHGVARYPASSSN